MTSLTKSEIEMLISLITEEKLRLPNSPVGDILKQTFKTITTKLKELIDECIIEDINNCPHCKMDKRIRNPSGFCDHLYYPDRCNICKEREAKEKVKG